MKDRARYLANWCLDQAEGDERKALLLACEEAVKWHQQVSAGYIRAVPTFSMLEPDPVPPAIDDDWVVTGAK